MPKNTTWKFAHLLAPSMSNHEDGITVPEMAKWLRHKFGEKTKHTRKIFISRDDAPARKLINAEESGITIQESVKEKGKKAELIESLIPFENISESIVLVSFK